MELRELKGGWFWINNKVMEHSEISCNEINVYATLAYLASKSRSEEITVTIRELIKKSHKSKSVVRKSLNKLEELDLIEIVSIQKEKEERKYRLLKVLSKKSSLPVKKKIVAPAKKHAPVTPKVEEVTASNENKALDDLPTKPNYLKNYSDSIQDLARQVALLIKNFSSLDCDEYDERILKLVAYLVKKDLDPSDIRALILIICENYWKNPELFNQFDKYYDAELVMRTMYGYTRSTSNRLSRKYSSEQIYSLYHGPSKFFGEEYGWITCGLQESKRVKTNNPWIDLGYYEYPIENEEEPFLTSDSEKHRRTHKEWTILESEMVKRYFKEGKTIEEMARRIQRSPDSILGRLKMCKLVNHEVTLKEINNN